MVVPPRVDYERYGRAYAVHRRADPRIAERIHAALGDSHTVVNVGAGTGSYEPDDRWVLAVEPSATMRAQRPPGAAPALDARAEELPFDDGAFDAAMACLTVHHWDPVRAGLAELRRVARGPVVVLTLDLSATPSWQREHLAEGLRLEEPRFPAPDRIAAALGGRTRIETIPTPADCADGVHRGVLESAGGTVGSVGTGRAVDVDAAASRNRGAHRRRTRHGAGLRRVGRSARTASRAART